MNAAVSQFDRRRLDATFVITNLNAVHALDAGLLHFLGYRMAVVARQAIDEGPDKEMGAEFLGGAEQLINVALAIADMDTPCGFAEQRIGLAHILEPTDAPLVLDRHARRIDPALERGVPLNFSRDQNLTAVTPTGRPSVVTASEECMSRRHTVWFWTRPALSLLLFTL